MFRNITPGLTLLILFAVLLSGCTIHRTIANHGVTANLGVELAENRVLFLNIVRSMHRFPQYHTAISELRGQASRSLTPSLSLSLKNGSDGGSGTTGIGASFGSGTTLVSVGVLDDQEFVRGILNPISLEQVEYFLQQGWPDRLIGMLFIRKLEIIDDNHVSKCNCKKRKYLSDSNGEAEPNKDTTHFVRSLVKDSKSGKDITETIYLNEIDERNRGNPFVQMDCFSERLLSLRTASGLSIRKGDSSQVGPSFFLAPSKVAQVALTANKDSLVLQLDPEQTACRSTPKRSEAQVDTESEDEPTDACYRLIKRKRELELFIDSDDKENKNKDGKSGRKQLAIQGTGSGEKYGVEEDSLHVRISFRSTDSVIYYLGEIMRGQAILLDKNPDIDRHTLKPLIGPQGNRSTLFLAYSDMGSKRPFVTVAYDDDQYVIPRLPGCEPGDVAGCHRSLQVLAIVKQLIGLNKKRESLPTTGVVSITGG